MSEESLEKRKPEGEPLQMSSVLVVGEDAAEIIRPARPRRPAGPLPDPMEMEKFRELQDRVYQAIERELPADWEFMCVLMGPQGEKEMIGSLHSSGKAAEFLEKLGSATNLRVWRK
jgi:hypothetical protein